MYSAFCLQTMTYTLQIGVCHWLKIILGHTRAQIQEVEEAEVTKMGYLAIMNTTRNPQNNKKASNYIDTHA